MNLCFKDYAVNLLERCCLPRSLCLIHTANTHQAGKNEQQFVSHWTDIETCSNLMTIPPILSMKMCQLFNFPFILKNPQTFPHIHLQQNLKNTITATPFYINQKVGIPTNIKLGYLPLGAHRHCKDAHSFRLGHQVGWSGCSGVDEPPFLLRRPLSPQG